MATNKATCVVLVELLLATSRSAAHVVVATPENRGCGGLIVVGAACMADRCANCIACSGGGRLAAGRNLPAVLLL